jgi:WD40 repeat protein
VNALAFSPDATLLASGGGDNTICIWNVSSGRLLHTLTGQEDPVSAVAFWPDGRKLESGTAHAAPFSHRGRFQTWDVATGARLSESAPVYEVSALVVRGDGQMLAVAYRCQGNWACVDLIRSDEGRILRRYVAHRNRISSLSFTPDGRWLVSAGVDGVVRVWR